MLLTDNHHHHGHHHHDVGVFVAKDDDKNTDAAFSSDRSKGTEPLTDDQKNGQVKPPSKSGEQKEGSIGDFTGAAVL